LNQLLLLFVTKSLCLMSSGVRFWPLIKIIIWIFLNKVFLMKFLALTLVEIVGSKSDYLFLIRVLERWVEVHGVIFKLFLFLFKFLQFICVGVLFSRLNCCLIHNGDVFTLKFLICVLNRIQLKGLSSLCVVESKALLWGLLGILLRNWIMSKWIAATRSNVKFGFKPLYFRLQSL
jgi:hypothetical protein